LLKSSAPLSGGQRWRQVAGLLWRIWEDEVVVYDDRSGDTYRLTPRSALVFLALQLPTLTEGAHSLDAEVIEGLASLGLVEQYG
jgi:hypothetical protein